MSSSLLNDLNDDSMQTSLTEDEIEKLLSSFNNFDQLKDFYYILKLVVDDEVDETMELDDYIAKMTDTADDEVDEISKE